MSDARGAASWDATEARGRLEDECRRLRERLADTETEKIERGTEILRLRERLATAREALADELEQKAEAVIRASVLREQLDAARRDLKRAAYLAEHLWQMIHPETWRDTGGDDGQGHYEGDYRAEQTRVEIQELAARAALGVEDEQEKP